MVKEISVTVFDEDTGEVISNKIKDKKYKIWKDGYGAMIKHKNKHKKIYNDYRLYDVIKDRGDLLKTYILMEHVDNNNLVYINKSKGAVKPANLIEIAYLLEITEKTAKEYLNRMIKKGILGKIVVELNDKNKYDAYAFNPVFVNSCRYINKDLYILFKSYINDYLPDWIKQKYSELI